VEDVGALGTPPAPDSGTVTFTGVTVNGAALSAAGQLHRASVQRGNTTLTAESPLAGGGFSVRWLYRQASKKPQSRPEGGTGIAAVGGRVRRCHPAGPEPITMLAVWLAPDSSVQVMETRLPGW